MRKYRKLLHLVHTTTYNSKNEKQPHFTLILHTRAQNYCTYTYTSTQNSTSHLSYTSTYSYIYTYNYNSTYTSTQTPPHDHYTPIHNHTVIHMKILTSQYITHTREYYTYKKVSESPHLTQLDHNKFKKIATETHHRI